MIRASAPVRFPVNELSAVTGHGSPIRLHAARIDLLTPVPFETRSIPSSLAATHRGFTLITRTARARASYPSCVAVYPCDSRSHLFYVARIPAAPFAVANHHSLTFSAPLQV